MYEIEIKSLLGNRENAERLEARMKDLDPSIRALGAHRQLNHYFEGRGDFRAAAKAMASEKDRKTFAALAEKAKDISLRTRDADGKIYLVLKAAIDDTTSANGTARREFESEVDMPIEKLDKILLDAGFKYQAKWSRERKEYKLSRGGTGSGADGGGNGGMTVNVTIDRNAGYGYLAEFEIIEEDPSRAETTKARLRELMAELGVEELAQDRLARMFAYYNAHWPEYYGTENIFVIE